MDPYASSKSPATVGETQFIFLITRKLVGRACGEQLHAPSVELGPRMYPSSSTAWRLHAVPPSLLQKAPNSGR